MPRIGDAAIGLVVSAPCRPSALRGDKFPRQVHALSPSGITHAKREGRGQGDTIHGGATGPAPVCGSLSRVFDAWPTERAGALPLT